MEVRLRRQQQRGDELHAPNGVGGPFGTFNFLTDQNFDPADPFTYPTRFRIRLGDMFFKVDDWRINGYVADKWQATDKLTLNLGLRYDYSDIVPDSKDAIAPRLGVAYATSDKMVFRGGVGKFYEPARNQFMYQVLSSSVIGSAYTFDTGNDRSATSGSAAGASLLESGGRWRRDARRSAPPVGPCWWTCATRTRPVRCSTTSPCSAGTRCWGTCGPGVRAWSVRSCRTSPSRSITSATSGTIKRAPSTSTKGRSGANGSVTRLGVNVFDPTGTLIPEAARGVNFRRVLQYQTLDAFNTDYHGLEVGVVKRMANRWSGRASYSLSRGRDVNVITGNANTVWDRRVNDDYGVTSGLNPRADFGLSNLANRHAFTAGGNWDVGHGLGIGSTFVYYTGNPVNELVGDDMNNDLDDFDRPIKGRDDKTIPILSEVDANGYAIHNSMPGYSDYLALNLRVQDELRLGAAARKLGVYWELYNATNRNNFGNPENKRNTAQFNTLIIGGAPRTMQLGLRYSF